MALPFLPGNSFNNAVSAFKFAVNKLKEAEKNEIQTLSTAMFLVLYNPHKLPQISLNADIYPDIKGTKGLLFYNIF